MNVTRAWRMVLGLLVSACIALLPTLAYAEDDSPAYEIFDNYLNQSNSVSEFNNYLINDLANRWFYADASKRAKVPVVQSAWTNVDGSLETILEEAGGNPSDAAYEFSTCQAIVSYIDVPAVPSQLYKLVTLDNNLAWDSTSMRAREYYRAWYEWFEGTSSGGNLELISNVVEVFYFAGYDKFGASNRYTLSYYNSLNTDASNKGIGYFLLFRLATKSGGSNSTASILYGSANPISYTVVDTGTSNSGYPIYQVTVTTDGTLYATPTSTSSLFDKSSFSVTYDGSVTFSRAGTSSNNYYVIGVYASDLGVGNTEPVWPVWPRPETPTEPDVPSQPTNITINWNNNSYTNNQTTTTTVDLQPILDAIRIVNDNLESGFLGLEADIRSCYDGMEQLLTSWFEYFGSWFQTISTQLDTWFRLLLQELRTANSWLRAIYYKSFGGNSSQPDVTSDTDDYWNWLFELLARIIEMLPDSLQEIIEELARLQNYFPFSVPWDIAFLLGLLDAQPVTPVIHGYLPTWGANGFVAQGVPLDIDLTEFDDIALLLRRAELIFFAITLLPATYDVLKGFREVLHS